MSAPGLSVVVTICATTKCRNTMKRIRGFEGKLLGLEALKVIAPLAEIFPVMWLLANTKS